MLRLLKLLIFVAIAAFVGLVGFAYLGDLEPDRSERAVPVTLDAD